MINIAQIGVGYWGPNLLRNLMVIPDCNVKAVVDLSEERRNFVNNLYNSIPTNNDIDIALNDPDIDAIVIATPAHSHFAIAMKALQKDKHILVEKPMATSVEEVEEIGKLAEEKGLVAMVGHTFLYNSAVRYVKKLIDSRVLGDIRYIYSQRVNLGRIRSDVDALWNFAPHDISIIQYWLDEAEPIHITKKGIDYVQKGIDDVVFMNIEYPDKILAHIHVSWLDPHKIRRMTVVGTKKMVVYDDISKDKITIYDKGIDRIAALGENMVFDDPKTFSFLHRDGEVEKPEIEWVEPLKTEIEHFIDCIQHGTPCFSDANHAKNVVKILEMDFE
jgi:predicted dehydrogenase|tara:strand:+ start:122 stop:1114 length:993 start_codon:yes stop_codon:yes gene_type:complete